MRLRPLLPLVLLFAAAPAAAQDTQPFHSEGGFSLELPAYWVRMPDSALDAARRSNARSGTPTTYEAGYRTNDAPFPLPPQVTIAWGRTGRTLTIEEFGAEFAAADAREQLQDGVDAAVQRVSTPRWDAEDGIAWVRTAVRVEGRPPAFSWMAMTLHPAGDRMVGLIYYAAAGEDETRMRDELRAALRSLRVD